MSEDTTSSTLISSHATGMFGPKDYHEAEWVPLYVEHMRFTYSLVPRTNWLIFFSLRCCYRSIVCDMAYWRLFSDDLTLQQSGEEDQ